jgi:hypothetical protein
MIRFKNTAGEKKYENAFEKLGSFNSLRACKIGISKLNIWRGNLKNTEYVLSKICLESRVVDSIEDLESILLKWRQSVRKQIKEIEYKKSILEKNINVNESKDKELQK